MRSRPRSGQLTIDAMDRAVIERWSRMRTALQRTVLRCRMVLLLGDGLSAREVARRLGVSRHTVDLWRKRFVEEGRDALLRDKPGRGRRALMVAQDFCVACEHTSRAEISPPQRDLRRTGSRGPRRGGSK